MNTAPFSSRLVYQDISSTEGRFRLILLEDVVYKNDTHKVIVPAGFITDLATIPQIFQSIISKVGPYNGAAIVHDWGYCVQFLTRKEVDDLFLEIMEKSGVGSFKRYTMYYFMRILGGIAWNICKADVSKYRAIAK